LDRATTPEKTIDLSQEQLVAIGKSCLKYTGTLNGAKMPVGIAIYEVANGPPSEDDRQRLIALRKTLPGLAKVWIHCYHADGAAKGAGGGGARGGVRGNRGGLQKKPREPRRTDGVRIETGPTGALAAPAEQALPKRENKPIATIALLLFLVGMFAVEHL